LDVVWASPEVSLLVVPAQGVVIGLALNNPRHIDSLSMKCVVLPAVLELLLDALAHLKNLRGRHGNVPGIKERMNVTTQQKAIGWVVAAASREWTNVRRL